MSRFTDALRSDGPHPDHFDALQLYGQFVGAWEMEAYAWKNGRRLSRGKGRIYFEWVLQGLAVQDVWILFNAFYGTHLRLYDPKACAWHIQWSNTLHLSAAQSIGRAEDDKIVEDSHPAMETRSRSLYSEISRKRFRRLIETSLDGGKTWSPQVEIIARRV